MRETVTVVADDGLDVGVDLLAGLGITKATGRLLQQQDADRREQRSMRTDGSIKWDGGMVFVGEAFAGETVGLQACDEGLWHVQLGPLRLSILHERSRTIVPTAGGVTHVPGHGEA